MYQYYFRIADVNIVFFAEYPVSWPDNMIPFSIDKDGCEKTNLFMRGNIAAGVTEIEAAKSGNIEIEAVKSGNAEIEAIKPENAEVETVKTASTKTENKSKVIKCFLRVSAADTDAASHNALSDRKLLKASHNALSDRKLLKTIPFGGMQDDYEIRFYCLQDRQIYLVEYPVILLQDGILFRRDNISGYLGLEFMLMDCGCFWLHASCVLWKGEGLVFSAPSGTGKSTQAGLWASLEGAEIVNGDRVLIKRIENIPESEGSAAEYRVYGSPFAGSSHIYKQKSGKLTAVFLLRQFGNNELEKLSPAQTFLRIYGEALHCPENHEYTEQLRQMIKSMVLELPIWELRCTPDERAVNLIVKEIGKQTFRLEN